MVNKESEISRFMRKQFELRMRNAGMFSNVNEVIQYLHLASTNNFQFMIDWRHSCYFEEKFGSNPWEYYFEQCFPDADSVESLPLFYQLANRLPVVKTILLLLVNKMGSVIHCYCQKIDTFLIN